jgi:hypothetical protein
VGLRTALAGRYGELKITDPTGTRNPTPSRSARRSPILILLPRLYFKYIIKIDYGYLNCKELAHDPIGIKINIRIPLTIYCLICSKEFCPAASVA